LGGTPFSSTPPLKLLAWLDEQKASGEWDYFLRRPRAHALAMLGRFDEARAILAEARAQLADRGDMPLEELQAFGRPSRTFGPKTARPPWR
jgi:hypothetical protein